MTEADLAALAFHAVLLAARLGGALMLLPGLGEAEVPATIRLALLLALVALLLPVLAPGLPTLPPGPVEAAALLVTESVVGIWLGLLARLVMLAMVQAGQAAALMIGLASPLQTDPMLGAQGTAPGRLLGLAAVLLVLGSGLYALPLRALVESYAALPAGAPLPLGAGAEAL
ncbi:MAG TPA: flagellar biosynthetic protein FliR, partial [Crenalkalicoccus sp.]|nr:flagellar biosynthetic protein FliR [Crenalkalicoccus sp.]